MIQNKAIKCLTRIYKNTETIVIYKIFNIVDIVKELEILCETDNVPIELRRNYKIDKRNETLNALNVNLIEPDLDINSVKHRYTLWLLTGTGPLKDFLFKIGKAEDNFCRFCYYENETSYHLLYECERYREKEFADFEKKCIYIVNDLFKHKHLIC